MDTGITITEFAKRQGVSRARVWQWMNHTPGIAPTRVGGLCLLSAEDQRRILTRPRGKPGRPKKTS
jgi:hypothetical protein